MTATTLSPEKRADLVRAARGERRPADGPVPMGIRVRGAVPAAAVETPALDGPEVLPASSLAAPVSDSAESGPDQDRDQVLSVDEVLERARASESARTRSLGEKIAALLTDLTGRVRVETEEARARAEAEQARKELVAQEAELARKLAEVRQRLRNTRHDSTSVAATTEVDPKVVRAWAAENGVECNAIGRVPQRVVDAWRAATGAEVAAS